MATPSPELVALAQEQANNPNSPVYDPNFVGAGPSNPDLAGPPNPISPTILEPGSVQPPPTPISDNAPVPTSGLPGNITSGIGFNGAGTKDVPQSGAGVDAPVNATPPAGVDTRPGALGTHDKNGVSYGETANGGGLVKDKNGNIVPAPMTVKPEDIGAKPVSGKPGEPPYTLPKYEKDWQAKQAEEAEAVRRQGEADKAIEDAKSAGALKVKEIGEGAVANDASMASDQKLATYMAQESMQQRMTEQEKTLNGLLAKKEDPGAFYKKIGTGGSILAAISIGLGALGAGMPHTTNHTNYALDIINKAVENDIASQRANLDNEWKVYSAKSGLSKDKFAMDNWKIEQMSKERETQWKVVKQQTLNAMAATDSETAKAEGAKLVAQTDQRINEIQKTAFDHRMTTAGKIAAQGAAAAAKAQGVRDWISNRVVERQKEFNESPAQAFAHAQEEANLKYKGVAPTSTDVSQTRAEKISADKSGGKGKEDRGVALNDAIKSITASYDNAVKTNPGILQTNVTANLQRIPEVGAAGQAITGDEKTGSNARLQVNGREQFNSELFTTAHKFLSIRAPDAIKEEIQPFQITQYDNAATIHQKRDNFAIWLRDQAAIEEGKKSDVVGQGPSE